MVLKKVLSASGYPNKTRHLGIIIKNERCRENKTLNTHLVAFGEKGRTWPSEDALTLNRGVGRAIIQQSRSHGRSIVAAKGNVLP